MTTGRSTGNAGGPRRGRTKQARRVGGLLIAAIVASASPGDRAIAAGAPAPPCDTPEHHALDFKIGVFDVTAGSGVRAGSSRVESLLRGCLIVEHWRGAISGHARAHFFYDRHRAQWRMVFVNDDGDVLDMAGVRDGDAVVFTGENSMRDFRGLHRMRWSPASGGGVLQVWDYSTDRGATWKPIHTGHYARRPGVRPASTRAMTSRSSEPK